MEEKDSVSLVSPTSDSSSDSDTEHTQAAPALEGPDDVAAIDHPDTPDASASPDDAEPFTSRSDEEVAAEFFVHESEPQQDTDDARWLAVLEAIVYVADEPLTLEQIARALEKPQPEVKGLLDRLVEEFNKPEHGLTVKEVAGGYKMATKAEHHEAVRTFVKRLNPPLKLSLAALETLAVIAYKQPITAPEIMEIRGVQGAGVLKTLLDRKLITTAGRKNVVGKPILYKTTKEFLVQFGLKDLSELPTLKEFEDLRRMAMHDDEEVEPPAEPNDVVEGAALAEAQPEEPEVSEADPEVKNTDE
jgi:segregation and condensation protein B